MFRLNIFSLVVSWLMISHLAPALGQRAAALAPFTYSSSTATASDAMTLYQEINTALSSCSRFATVARDAPWGDRITKERELQKGEAFLDGNVVAQGGSMGAEILFMGHLIGVDRKMGATNPIFSLLAVEVGTGKILGSKILTKVSSQDLYLADAGAALSDSDYSGFKDMDKLSTALAIKNTLELMSPTALQKRVQSFLDEFFPLKLEMFHFEEGKKGIESFLIEGAEVCYKKNETLEIVERSQVETPSGKTLNRDEVIAVAAVYEHQGEVVECRVKTGKDILKEKMGQPNIFLRTKH